MTDAVTVPGEVIPLTATLYVVPEPVTIAVVGPAVPPNVTPALVNPVTAVLNTTAKLIDEAHKMNELADGAGPKSK